MEEQKYIVGECYPASKEVIHAFAEAKAAKDIAEHILKRRTLLFTPLKLKRAWKFTSLSIRKEAIAWRIASKEYPGLVNVDHICGYSNTGEICLMKKKGAENG